MPVAKKRVSSEQYTIRELIAMKTPASLQEAWLQIQSEADCMSVEQHPAYLAYMQAIQGFTFVPSA